MVSYPSTGDNCGAHLLPSKNNLRTDNKYSLNTKAQKLASMPRAVVAPNVCHPKGAGMSEAALDLRSKRCPYLLAGSSPSKVCGLTRPVHVDHHLQNGKRQQG